MAFNGVRGAEDRIAVKLGGEQVFTLERYEIKRAILTQPSASSFSLGTGDQVADLIARFPPRTKFELLVNDLLCVTGRIDGCASSGAPGILTLHGRDTLAALQQGYVPNEFSINNVTYAQLVRQVMDKAGLKDVKLAYSNTANRRAITGAHPNELQPPRNVEEEQVETEAGSGGLVKRSVQAHLGETWYQFLKRHLDRAGLFLWAAGDGSFVLSEPNPNQIALYQITRTYLGNIGAGISSPSSLAAPQSVYADASTIIDHSFTNDTTPRFASVAVYARGGGRKSGRTTATARVADEEMKRWGATEELTLRDVNADTPKKAEFWARKKIAETRRQGWRLSYTVYGHTAVPIAGGAPIPWAPDTMVHVHDDKLGFDDIFYVEGVTFRSSPETTTVLDLCRPDDLVFGARPPPGPDGVSDLAI